MASVFTKPETSSRKANSSETMSSESNNLILIDRLSESEPAE